MGSESTGAQRGRTVIRDLMLLGYHSSDSKHSEKRVNVYAILYSTTVYQKSSKLTGFKSAGGLIECLVACVKMND